MLRIIVSLTIAAVVLGTVLGAAAALDVTSSHLAAFDFLVDIEIPPPPGP